MADPNPQKNDGPVLTPQRARDLVREIRAKQGAGEIHVYLRGGIYFLSQPLILSPQDSGGKVAVTWSAYLNERPILSGGRAVTGWTKTSVNGRDAWVATIPGGTDATVFRELWLNGKRLTRARSPKQGTSALPALSGDEKHDDWLKGVTQFNYSNTDLHSWPTAADGEVILTNRWVESHLPIESIDEKAHMAHFKKRTVFLPETGDLYWVENVRECLTDPGEFYVDPREKRVYLIPPSSMDPNHAEIIAPRLAQVLKLAGDPGAGKFVEHLTFHNIGFANNEWYFDQDFVAQQEAADAADAQWALHPNPQRSGFDQADVGVPAAVLGIGVRSCLFEGCEISNVGTYGIELSQGCQTNRISRCKMTDLGAGGVKIGEVASRDDSNEQTFGNELSDCIIADGGNLFPSCVAVWIGKSHNNVVAHNDIHGFWYTAISMGWSWGYGGDDAQGNTIEYNHIHHIGTKADGVPPILSDMGAVYTLGNQQRSVIRFNRIHDIAGLHYGGWGIYFDEGTTGILAENNLVYRTTHGGFHQHYGQNNLFRNNILAFGRDRQIQRTRVEDHLSFTFERNIVFWDHGELLFGSGWEKGKVAFDFNTYWRTTPGEILFNGNTWGQWQKAGMDEHSTIAAPHFVDPANGDFTMRNPSAAGERFHQFDLTSVGPR